MRKYVKHFLNGNDKELRFWLPRTSHYFCPSIELCADIYCAFRIYLSDNICYVEMFQSCTTDEVKDSIRNDMTKENGQFCVIIATSAAGMAVNYKAANNVIRFAPPPPKVWMDWRAGRDGTQSYQVRIYNSRHLRKLDSDMLEYVNNVNVCRWHKLLSAYDSVPKENFVKHICCDLCDKQRKCNEGDYESFISMLIKYRSELEFESSSESDGDLVSSFSSSQSITEYQSDWYIVIYTLIKCTILH